jgi:hypothetical protein
VASHTISGQAWADGTTVGVYPAVAVPAGSDVPSGPLVTSAVVSGGQVTFVDLSEKVRYYAYAAGVGKFFLISTTLKEGDRARIETLEAEVGSSPSSRLDAVQAGVERASAYSLAGDLVRDDRAALQAAADAVLTGGIFTGGSVLFIPDGTYLVSGPVYVKSGTVVQGAGMGATVVRKKASSFVAAATNDDLDGQSVFACGPSSGAVYSSGTRGSTVTFRDLTIDGNKANQTFSGITDYHYGGAHGIGAKYIDTLTIQRVRIQDTAQNGVFPWQAGKVTVDNCELLNCGSSNAAFATLTKNAISLGGSAGGPPVAVYRVTNNYISGPEDEGVQYGYAQDVLISGNHFYSCGSNAVEGDTAFAGTAGGNVIVEGNFIRGTVEYAIDIGNADQQKIRVQGNTILATAQGGIRVVQANESAIDVVDNTIDGVGGGYAAGSTTSFHAIDITGHRVKVAGNGIYDCSGIAISVLSARVLTIDGNTAENIKRNMVNIAYATAGTYRAVAIRANDGHAIDAHAFLISVNGTLERLLIDGNTLGNVSSVGASQHACSITGASTIVRRLIFTGNVTVDERGTQEMGNSLEGSGASSIVRTVIDGNTMGGKFTGIGGRNKFTSVVEGVNYVDNNGGPARQVWQAATPTAGQGQFSQGHTFFYPAPVEAGTAGSKYVELGQVCVSGGSPGTWVPIRVLTGN